MHFLLFLALTSAAAAQPPDDLRTLVRDSLRFLTSDKKIADDYTYNFRNEVKQFDSGGKLKEERITAGEKVYQDGLGVMRVLERNGRKLTEAELRKQQDLFDAKLAEMRSLSAEEREKRRRRTAQDDSWQKELSEALDYKYIGEEAVNGRTAIVLSCEPRPGYEPKNIRARVFTKTTGKLWIDKAERELTRADAEVFDTVSVGFGIIGKIEKGTRFHIERMRLPEGTWMISSQSVRFGARVMLVKYISNEIHNRYWNYKPKSQQASAKTVQSEVQAASVTGLSH
jgi:hypothetical protein